MALVALAAVLHTPGPAVAATYETVGGTDRFGTAIAVSQRAFPHGAGTVIVATGRNWPDALGGAALSRAHDAPILLCDTDSVPGIVLAEIDRLEAFDAVILGGPGAVGPGAEADLRGALVEGHVRRIGGRDRYETAQLIAAEVADDLQTEWDRTALVATGADFADALGASPLCASRGWPVFLKAPGGEVPVAAMQSIGTRTVRILGGTGVVSRDEFIGLWDDFGAARVFRHGGDDRYETALEIARFSTGVGASWDGLAIATGRDYPDALAGGVLAGRDGTVLLLTPSRGLHPSVANELDARRDGIDTVVFLGGTGAVSQAVRDEVAQILE
jgi:putative cell wall-binding protein